MLRIHNKPTYLSPSSLMLAEGCPNKFYSERLAEFKAPKEPQGPAAAAGSSFDSYVKDYLCLQTGRVNDVRTRMLKVDSKLQQYDNLLDVLFYSSVEPQHHTLVRDFGKFMVNWYKYIPFVKETQWVDFEQHINYVIFSHHVPLYMKLDASVNLSGMTVPFDWKVKGFGNVDGASPDPGYMYIYDNTKGLVSGAHDLWHKDISMDTINIKWATQLATYGWGLGRPIGTPFQAVIDCLVFRPTGWRVARYIGWITKTFQTELVRRYSYIWESIQNGSYIKQLVQDPVVVEFKSMQEKWWMS